MPDGGKRHKSKNIYGAANSVQLDRPNLSPLAEFGAYGKPSLTLLIDARISDADIRLWSIIDAIGGWKGKPVAVNHKQIGWSERTMRRSAQRLKSAGYLEIVRRQNCINEYSVIRPHVNKKSEPITRPKKAPTKTCGECHRAVYGVNRAGICRGCVSEQRTRRIAREEIAAAS